jgi:hypothetical protein
MGKMERLRWSSPSARAESKKDRQGEHRKGMTSSSKILTVRTRREMFATCAGDCRHFQFNRPRSRNNGRVPGTHCRN